MSKGRDSLRKAKRAATAEEQAMMRKAVAASTVWICPNCGCDAYVEARQIRRMSPLMLPAGVKNYFVSDPALVCLNCKRPVMTKELEDGHGPKQKSDEPNTPSEEGRSVDGSNDNDGSTTGSESGGNGEVHQ